MTLGHASLFAFLFWSRAENLQLCSEPGQLLPSEGLFKPSIPTYAGACYIINIFLATT